MSRTQDSSTSTRPTAERRRALLGSAIWPTLRLLQVRLRVPAALLIAGLAAGRWDAIRNHWDKLTRAATTRDAALGVVSNDVEYFCPMDPGVISGWPDRCGVCHMTLVSRRKGDATMLPDGVIARMQFSPYRVQLAGVLSAPARFRPLEVSHKALGVVDRVDGRARVQTEFSARRAHWAADCLEASVLCNDLPGMEPYKGRIEETSRVVIDGVETLRFVIAVEGGEAGDAALRPGMSAEATFRVLAADIEPFRSLKADPPPHKAGEPAQVYACLDHVDSVGLDPTRCPIDNQSRTFHRLEEHERVRWWCPMHPTLTADRPGRVCDECGGMSLKPRVVSFRPAGQVLAVPESAVVDTGSRRIVFVETMPGMFDGVEVVLGPRCGADYPVVRGLEPGHVIAITGAFLLDAETRLNPSLAAGYFGAARDQAATAPSAVKAVSPEEEALSQLSPGDRALALRQRICPVTRKPLGSMGAPERVEIDGRTAFLCCSGCEAKFRRDAARYLAELPEPDAKSP